MNKGSYKFERNGNPPVVINFIVSDAICILNDVEIEDEGLRALETTIRNVRRALHVQKDLAKKARQ